MINKVPQGGVRINKERVELFAAALESGEYAQCTNKLLIRRRTFSGEIEEYYCALGVAIQVALDNGLTWLLPPDGLFLGGALPPTVADWYGFDTTNPVVVYNGTLVPIVILNDSFVEFWDIAQGLRAEYLKDGNDG